MLRLDWGFTGNKGKRGKGGGGWNGRYEFVYTKGWILDQECKRRLGRVYWGIVGVKCDRVYCFARKGKGKGKGDHKRQQNKDKGKGQMAAHKLGKM